MTDAQQLQTITEEVQELARKRAIDPAPSEGEFSSTIFLVPKSDGAWRPVIIKPQVSQQACYDSSFQDEIDKDREGPDTTGECVTQVRLERCLSLGSDVQRTPEISEVPVASPILAISSSTIWAEQYVHHRCLQSS